MRIGCAVRGSGSPGRPWPACLGAVVPLFASDLKGPDGRYARPVPERHKQRLDRRPDGLRGSGDERL